MIHELAYASHWNRGRWVFHATDDYVVESWAVGVQWVLTRMVYGTSYTIEFKFNKPAYTLVVVDMMDEEKKVISRYVCLVQIKQLFDPKLKYLVQHE